ncbi:hypothetical protein V1512DRAFT_265722 [Lipomyces arxii]|uniref:uncharacterized protein n=1 Tax=Lipomyces arxii TaxID=56418 RepID=UPI0034CF19A9
MESKPTSTTIDRKQLALIAQKRAREYDENAFFSRKGAMQMFREDKKERKKKQKKKVNESGEISIRRARNTTKSQSIEIRSDRSSSPIIVSESRSQSVALEEAKVQRLASLSPPPKLSKTEIDAARNALLDFAANERLGIVHHDSDDSDVEQEKDDITEDLMPELAARYRAQLQSTAQNIEADSTSMKGTLNAPSFVVHILVDTTIELEDQEHNMNRIKSSMFKIKSTYPFRKIRQGWIKKFTLPPELANEIVLLDKNTYSRLYDDGTPNQVGVTEFEPRLGILAVKKSEVKQLRESLFEELYASDKEAEDSSTNESDRDQVENESETAPVNGIRVFLQDGQGEKMKLMVKPESKISQIIAYYRRKRGIDDKKKVVLELDDEEINESLIVSATEIEDEITIDVHVR